MAAMVLSQLGADDAAAAGVPLPAVALRLAETCCTICCTRACCTSLSCFTWRRYSQGSRGPFCSACSRKALMGRLQQRQRHSHVS